MTMDPWNDRRTPSISGTSPDAAPLASIAMSSPRAPSGTTAPAGSVAPLAAERAPLATGRVPLAAIAAAAAAAPRGSEAPAPLAFTAVSGPSRSDPGWAVRWQPSEASAAVTAAAAAAAPAGAAARPAPTLSRSAGARSPALTATWYTTRAARARTAT